jgi:nitrous oxide reductase
MDRRRLISTAALAGTALAVTRGLAIAEADGGATTMSAACRRRARALPLTI